MKKHSITKRIITVVLSAALVIGCVGTISAQKTNAYDYSTEVTVGNSADSDIYAAVTRHSGSYYDWQEYGFTVRNNSSSAVSNITISVPVESGSISNFKCWGISAKYSNNTVTLKYSGTLQPGESYTTSNDDKFGFGGGALFGTPTITANDASSTDSDDETVDGLKYSVTGAVKDMDYSETPVGKHGTLSVKKVDGYTAPTIVDESGNAVQLRGASSHGVQWYPEYINKAAMQSLRDEWGLNTIRLALYAKEGGYTQGSQSLMDSKISEAVSAAQDLGMYVIIDWHVLSYNPNDTLSEARTFFKKYATEYKNCSNVLFEICNEPTGTSWYDGSGNDLYTYCKTVVSDIRGCGANNIVICGTNDWSQRVDEVSAKPLSADGYDNIMYALHFYSASHYDNIKDYFQKAIDAGTPIFVTEFGSCDASGNGTYDFDNATDWINLLTENNVSYACWSLCNKAEASSLISSSCSKTSNWTASDLTEAGKWLINTSCALAERDGYYYDLVGSATTDKTQEEITEVETTEEETTEEETTELETIEEATSEVESSEVESSESKSSESAPVESETAQTKPSESTSSNSSSSQTSSSANVSATASISSEWDGGLVGSIVVNNNGSSSISGWTVEFDYPDEISNVWCAKAVSHSGNHYVFSAADYNGYVSSNGSASFGFIASKTSGKDCKITNVKVYSN